MLHQRSPEQKPKIARQKERRRRERERRDDEYRRRLEELRRRIAEARKRRQRLLLMVLLALFAALEAMRPKFLCSKNWLEPTRDPTNWTPDPSSDYAPAPGNDDHCDGYSYQQWARMVDARGIKLSRKAELKEAWTADPDYVHFPQRYREWGYRPFLGEIMDELKAEYWRADAFAALKLLTPTEVHAYLNEEYAAGSTFRRCFADRDADIVKSLQMHATLREERKRREVEDARKAKRNPKRDDEEKKFEP